MITIDRTTYFDKVEGCWFGKSSGGTLGTPLEKIFGQDELFNVWWYPKIEPGGMPNDDLEIQLVWLQALQDRGPQLTAKDLADHWLKCIWYNPDEYGLHKTNLRKGLVPPISGWYNNWFKHCMGSPIRSEIWACVAPGEPAIAAQYAYYDAICDHAGGESVYGEIFNAVIESAAFFTTEIKQIPELLQLGLKAIPADCETAKAIRCAIDAKNTGLDWKAARQKVKDAVYSPIAQYSPINLGFQTIGLLYGNDFGDAICKAVNCGWDTDCTGATVGALWGIIVGKKGLPAKWIDPLGDSVVVSRAIKEIHVPLNVKDLTEMTCKMGETVLAAFKSSVKIGDVNHWEDAPAYLLSKIPQIMEINKVKPYSIVFKSATLETTVNMAEGPVILPEQPFPLQLQLINLTSTKIQGILTVKLPSGFQNLTPLGNIGLNPNQPLTINLQLQAGLKAINTSDPIEVQFTADNQTPYAPIQFVVVGGYRWLVSSVDHTLTQLKQKNKFEKARKSSKLDPGWTAVTWRENALEIEPLFQQKPGMLYLRHYVYSPDKRKVTIGVPNNNEMQLWVNGKNILKTRKKVPLRPNYSGDGANYMNVHFKPGWNHIMVKIIRGDAPLLAHLTLALAEDHRGMADLLECHFPFE